MARTNIDDHDVIKFEAAEAIEQFKLVVLTASEQLKLAKAGERAFVCEETLEAGQYGTIALPGPQTKGIAGATVKCGALAAVNASGELFDAAAVSGSSTYIVGTFLANGSAGEVVPFTQHPTGTFIPES